MNRIVLIFFLSVAMIFPAVADQVVKPPPVKPDLLLSISETEPAAGDGAAEDNQAESAPLPYVGNMQTYVSVYEDTMVKLARSNNLGFVELRAANPHVDPWLPGADVKITLPTRHLLPDTEREGVVIDLAAMRLFFFKEEGESPVTHPLGVGREGLLTPIGKTHVRAKKEGPSWRPTKRMREEDPDLPAVVPPGPENPLGTHMLYLGWPEYGIHGTDKPYGIGRRVSSGCIRMYPEDIVTLYPEVPVGTPVTVVNQPVKAAWIDGVFYVEAHPTMEQADVMEETGGRLSYEMTEAEMRIIIQAAGDYFSHLDWRKLRTVIRERRGYPVMVISEAVAKEADDQQS